LRQTVTLPRLDHVETSADLASSLAAMTDRLSTPGRFEPASATPQKPDQPATMAELDIPAAEPDPSTSADRPDARSSLPGRVGGPSETGSRTGARAADTSTPAAANHAGSGEEVHRRPIPDIYRLRVDPNRQLLAETHGGTSETEAAVRLALKWLAENQKPDGRWDASNHAAGRELAVAGRDRLGAGIEADTGMTGLALLSFLASGHTHLDGQYRENVRLGLQYLWRAQTDDGCLAGEATTYAAMYCHSMAAFAMSEAYGMTDDSRLRTPVEAAMRYTIAAQEPSSGGWRYRPGDPGDTSQAGWQLMALKSAELAGMEIPVVTRNGLIRYLRSVSAGEHGGLASYRPNERISRPMTAEALVCWQFLGLDRDHPAGDEAGEYLLGELPGMGTANLYYWYYGTLAMFQLQGEYWERWNAALQTTLLASQRRSGPMAGSWDPATVWGGYGGRVYSTALAALCLEVYYRYLPLYEDISPPEGG
jgi:hypothetical protein